MTSFEEWVVVLFAMAIVSGIGFIYVLIAISATSSDIIRIINAMRGK